MTQTVDTMPVRIQKQLTKELSSTKKIFGCKFYKITEQFQDVFSIKNIISFR